MLSHVLWGHVFELEIRGGGFGWKRMKCVVYIGDKTHSWKFAILEPKKVKILTF